MVNMKKRLFHVLLSIALMFSMIPTVFAEGNEAKVGETEYATLQSAVEAASTDSVVLLKAVELNSPLIAVGKTIDLNGKTLTGDVLGTIIVNNGYLITGDSIKMIAPDTYTGGDYCYLGSADAKFTVEPTQDVTFLTGTVTVGSNWRTLPGQTVTIAEGAEFVVPAGKTFEVLGSAVVNGKATVNGTVQLGKVYEYAGQPVDTTGATLKASEDLNVVSGIAGYKVVYNNGTYSLVDNTNDVAKVGNTTYATLQEALNAADTNPVVLLKDVKLNEVLVAVGKTIDLNGKTLNGNVVGTVIVNGGYLVTGDDIKMIAPDTYTGGDYCYLGSADAKFTVEPTQDVTFLTGKVTVGSDWRTLPGQTVTANAGTTFEVPTGKTFIVRGNAVVNGSAVVNGTVQLGDEYEYIGQPVDTTGATLKASEDLNVVSGIVGYKVVYNNGTYSLVDNTNDVAKVGNTTYATLQEALGVAGTGDEVVLLKDVSSSEIITINKSITLDGNGKKLTSTAGRAINVSGADGVIIKNLTISATGERAINIIQNATNVTISNVTATSANYTVNLASSAPNAVVAINNSTLNGLCTVNVASAGAKVTVDSSIVNCNDNNTTAGEGYSALSLNNEAVGGSIVATNTTVNVAEGSDSSKGRNSAENGTVTINGSTDDVLVIVAVIRYEGSPYYHSFASIATAVEFAKAEDTVKLIRDVTLSEVLVAVGKTIDLNGKTLTGNVVGTVIVNGGYLVTGDSIKMIAPDTYTGGDYCYLGSADAKFTVDPTGSVTFLTGKVTVGSDWRTLPGQTVTVVEGAEFVVPEGKTFEVLGSAVVTGTATVDGIVKLGKAYEYNGQPVDTTGATLKAAEGLNVVSGLEGYKAVYNNGTYSLVKLIEVIPTDKSYVEVPVETDGDNAMTESTVTDLITTVQNENKTAAVVDATTFETIKTEQLQQLANATVSLIVVSEDAKIQVELKPSVNDNTAYVAGASVSTVSSSTIVDSSSSYGKALGDGDEIAKELAESTTPNLLITFNHHGDVPGDKANVKVNVSATYDNGEMVAVYHIVEESGKFVLKLVGEFEVKDGVLSFDITSCSQYVMKLVENSSSPTPTPTPTPTPAPSTVPNTSDNSNMMMWAGIAILSLLAAIATTVGRKFQIGK